MPGQRLRQPHRVAIEILTPLALLAAAFVLLWGVVLKPIWERSPGLNDFRAQPTLATRPTKPT